jgi:hypothetical protein
MHGPSVATGRAQFLQFLSSVWPTAPTTVATAFIAVDEHENKNGGELEKVS